MSERSIRIGPFRIPAAPAVVFGLGIAAGVAIYLYAHRDFGAIERTKEQGAALVAALEAFRREHGRYPDALGELVPEFLPRIDPPAWGLGWEYRRYPAEPTSPGAGPQAPGGDPAARTAAAGSAPPPADERPVETGTTTDPDPRRAEYFHLSTPANESRYPILYYDIADGRWTLNN